MKLLRSIGVDLRRAVFSVGFLCCVLGVFLMCFANTVGFDPQTMDPLTIHAALMRPDLVKQDVHYCAFYVFTAGSPLWVTMFMPVLAAFAYVPLLCDERRTQLSRLLIARQGKLRYTAAHIFGAMLTGGLTMLCGFALFGIADVILFPSLQSYDSAAISSFLEEQSAGYPEIIAEKICAGAFTPAILLKCSEMFLFGAVSALPALACAAITQNKYTVLCLPFFAAYSWNQLITRLSARAFMQPETNMNWLRFLAVCPTNSVLSVFEHSTAEILALHGGIALLMMFLFIGIMQRRRDCGT